MTDSLSTTALLAWETDLDRSLMIQDPAANPTAAVVWTAAEINYSGIADEEFSQ